MRKFKEEYIMRITGLRFGMDIDSMVKELMTAKRAPLDKLSQQQTLARLAAGTISGH